MSYMLRTCPPLLSMTTNLKSAVKLKSASNGEGLEHDDQQLVQPESSTYKGLIGLLLHNVRVNA